MEIKYIDDTIPFSKRHVGETIREIIRYDSGYLEDLFLQDEHLCFDPKCFKEICHLTKGHKDNWETPNKPGLTCFAKNKPLHVPYLYDFNDIKLMALNNAKLKK